jgi:hypothetical protein
MAGSALNGRFLLTDYCSGNFWDLAPVDNGNWLATRHTNLRAFGFVAFGEDINHELYVANVSDGTLYHIGLASGQQRPSGEPSDWLYLPLVETVQGIPNICGN